MKTSNTLLICTRQELTGELKDWEEIDPPKGADPVKTALDWVSGIRPAILWLCLPGALRYDNGKPLTINRYDLEWEARP